MGAAVDEGFKNMYKKNLKTANVRDYFLSRIENEIEDVRLNGAEPGNERLPGNLNISFKGIEGETLLVHFLYHRQRLINVEFIHIERVLRQVQPAIQENRGFPM